MVGQRDASKPNGTDFVPIDALPDPVLGYDLTDEHVIIVTTNDAFEEVFDISVELPVSRWLRSETTADQEIIKGVCSSLRANDRIATTLALSDNPQVAMPTEYRLRNLRGTGDRSALDGYIQLTERQPPSDETIGAGHIASIISHDLRNPLDVANAHLQAARETGATEHFDELRDSHDRMEQIIGDVLELTRGEQSLTTTSGVRLENVATDAWTSVDTNDASLSLADDLPTCEADSGRLQRLFENLFRNSVEHARSGNGGVSDDEQSGSPGGKLHISVENTPDGFFVADDGTGIPVTEHERVFDPGYSSAETGHGTGLGLTIVEQIAHAHGWTVSLSNGAAGGAKFEFRFTSEGR